MSNDGKGAIHEIPQEYLCPITTDLPVDPMTAEDGTVKQSKIVCDTKKKAEGGDVEAMDNLSQWYSSGKNGLAREAEMAQLWSDKRMVQLTKNKAEDGDTVAMNELGDWYNEGSHGLSVDESAAFKWVKKAADKRDARGLTTAGLLLVRGCDGVEQNTTYGVALTSAAAELGSDLANCNMGIWYLRGKFGLPVDKTQAKYYLAKGLSDSCTVSLMDLVLRASAGGILAQLNVENA